MSAVAGLLLAAGAGSRFGGPKARVQLEGRTLLERGIELLRAGGCEPVVVVLGADRDVVAAGARTVHAADWADGIGASLRAGLAALSDTEVGACIVTLLDQPLVGVEAVRRLLALPGDPPAAIATYDGATGHPVLLSRSIWEDVAALATGDVGARRWLDAHRGQVTAVACDDTGSPQDIDTAEDLAAVRALL